MLGSYEAGYALQAERCRLNAAGSTLPAHEALDAVHGLFDLLVGGRVAHPHVTGPGRPKGGARNHRHALLDEQLLGERLVIHAGAGDLGEAVEGAARLEAA